MKTRRAQLPSVSRQPNAPPSPLPPVLLEELIVEILSWLPVKSLLQFRCVCKSWKSLISDPIFMKLHLQRSARNANLLLLWKHISNDIEENNLSAVLCPVRSLLKNPSSVIANGDCYRLNDKNCYWVVGSCNGLVCLLGYIIENAFEDYWLCLWNPATRLSCRNLARFRVDRGPPQFSFFKFAFGYDNLSDTYKVVAFRLDSENKEVSQKTQVRVYSMGDNNWRNIQSFPVVPVAVRHTGDNDGVYLNGTLNWLALCNLSSDDYKWDNTITIDQLLIISLDLGNETYRQLLLPCGLDEVPYRVPCIGVLRDCLCVSHDYKRTHFVVWQMNEFGVENSWTQLVNVSYQHLQIGSFPLPPPLPVCISEYGDVVVLAKNRDLEAILYNRRDNTVEHTEIHKNICWTFTKDYVESLVSPCSN